ncbi:unnamed protein product [Rotaria socialis]|uniref:EGF-like domain-containing protein n=1 Tax=Rotaria socialis TaxID=392032 RepID=A0A821TFS6_9BILA|nr:unnamed protein product [Rotaria socialis]CAF4570456.1 unnamed protein product [Rotaria socialis]CAF4873715.1 unnamed protein product [Rotaria socialis]
MLHTNDEQRTTIQQIPFRSYCNSFWDLYSGLDESPSLCKNWTCLDDQYQCLTGQCIELEWVCDGEWDCMDASDEEAFVLMEDQLSHSRNVRLPNIAVLLHSCRKRYLNSTFSNKCSASVELGCFLSQVSNPLDIKTNRPCVNLTQLGDGIEDCYNAYDERNSLKVRSSISDMLGYQLPCGNFTMKHPFVCQPKNKNNCTLILCSNHRDTSTLCSGHNDVICLEENRCVTNGRCNRQQDCLHGADEYWCPSDLSTNGMLYRLVERRKLSGMTVNPEEKEVPISYSYACNRGVTIINLNETRCVCPPAYYGRFCEFFSDRITIMVKVDEKTVF